jgi:pimeloyl-ACP methyl ester carboxylesterase
MLPFQNPPLRETAVGGVNLSWRELGEGPALVLVHGIGGNSAGWSKQFHQLSADYRVIAWDAPGYGGSDLLEGATADSYADLLFGLLTHLGVYSASVVGHSLGGIIVGALAKASTELVQSAVLLQSLIGAGALNSEQQRDLRNSRARELISLGAHDFARRRAEMILGSTIDARDRNYVVEIMSAVPVNAYLEALNVICTSDIYTYTPFLKCRSLVIAGTEDPVSPPAELQKLAAALQHGVYKELEGVGHFASVEASDRLHQILDDFLSR